MMPLRASVLFRAAARDLEAEDEDDREPESPYTAVARSYVNVVRVGQLAILERHGLFVAVAVLLPDGLAGGHYGEASVEWSHTWYLGPRLMPRAEVRVRRRPLVLRPLSMSAAEWKRFRAFALAEQRRVERLRRTAQVMERWRERHTAAPGLDAWRGPAHSAAAETP